MLVRDLAFLSSGGRERQIARRYVDPKIFFSNKTEYFSEYPHFLYANRHSAEYKLHLVCSFLPRLCEHAVVLLGRAGCYVAVLVLIAHGQSYVNLLSYAGVRLLPSC